MWSFIQPSKCQKSSFRRTGVFCHCHRLPCTVSSMISDARQSFPHFYSGVIQAMWPKFNPHPLCNAEKPFTLLSLYVCFPPISLEHSLFTNVMSSALSARTLKGTLAHYFCFKCVQSSCHKSQESPSAGFVFFLNKQIKLNHWRAALF